MKRKKNFNNYSYYGKKEIGIALVNKKKEVIGICLIDSQDLKKVSKHHWHLDKKGYCRSSDTFNKVYIHNLIMNIKHSYSKGVDHINRIPLDNRKHNLRIVSYQDNLRNRGIFKNNTSGVVGICYESSRGKWRVQKNEIFIGRYADWNKANEALIKHKS